MKHENQNLPITKPTLKLFTPYRQTILGFFVVSLLVAMTILIVQLLLAA